MHKVAPPRRGATGSEPFRPSSLWLGLGSNRGGTEGDRRLFHTRLPASWKAAVAGSPAPARIKPALVWLLEVPRFVYFGLGALILGGLVSVVSVYAYISAPVAIPPANLGSMAQAGHIYAADGTLIGDLGATNRQAVPLSAISTPMKQAVIAAEDGTFYQHNALDFKSLVRAMLVDVLSGRWAEGGSGITQQYVKLTYGNDQRTLGRKLAEARLAYQISRRLTKDQILGRYLNTVYFGQGAYGVQAGALTYFNKPASELNVSEASLLAGLLPAPTALNPDVYPAAAEYRRQYVLGRMQADGFITAAVADQARVTKPTLSPPPATSAVALKYPWFVDTVRAYLFQKYGAARVLAGGFNVTTTLQPRQQDAARATVAAALPSSSDPSAALVSIDPSTGYVTAMVGGRTFGPQQFNLATQGRRQPGSAMKPFVLIAALEHGISPLTVYDAPAHICLVGWLPTCQVSTYLNESFGSINLEKATTFSVNTVYAQLIMQVGPANVVKVANRMGIPGPKWLLPVIPGCRPSGSPACLAHLIAEPSLALGSNDVSPLEMASAYATLADHGIYHEPKFVSEVTDAQGRVLENGPSPGQQAVDPNIVDTVNSILSNVITTGTGTGASIGRPAAGKTGTTNNFTNAWFVGYTPELATSVWVGYPASDRPLLGVEGVAQVAGGTIPASMWASYMKAALPPATAATLSQDSSALGLSNSPISNFASSTVGGATVASAGGGGPETCTLAQTPAPLPSPVPGAGYNVYPYLRCHAGQASAGQSPTFIPPQGAPLTASGNTPGTTSGNISASTPGSTPQAPVPTDQTPAQASPPAHCLLILCG